MTVTDATGWPMKGCTRSWDRTLTLNAASQEVVERGTVERAAWQQALKLLVEDPISLMV